MTHAEAGRLGGLKKKGTSGGNLAGMIGKKKGFISKSSQRKSSQRKIASGKWITHDAVGRKLKHPHAANNKTGVFGPSGPRAYTG